MVRKLWMTQWQWQKELSYTVSVVREVSGFSRVASTRNELGDERSHLYFLWDTGISESLFKELCVGNTEKELHEICFQEWSQCSPLLTKRLTGSHEESCMLPPLSPSLHSVCTLILRVKRKGTRVKGTTGVSRDKWGLQWIQFMCMDKKWLRKIIIEYFRWMHSQEPQL